METKQSLQNRENLDPGGLSDSMWATLAYEEIGHGPLNKECPNLEGLPVLMWNILATIKNNWTCFEHNYHVQNSIKYLNFENP